MSGVQVTEATVKELCDAAQLAVELAKKAGADAVVDIKSLHKNREFRSATQYECRIGWFAAGVYSP